MPKISIHPITCIGHHSIYSVFVGVHGFVLQEQLSAKSLLVCGVLVGCLVRRLRQFCGYCHE